MPNKQPRFTFEAISEEAARNVPVDHAPYGRCKCGAVLPREETSIKPIKQPTVSGTGRTYNKTVGYTFNRKCRKCGTDNITQEMMQ